MLKTCYGTVNTDLWDESKCKCKNTFLVTDLYKEKKKQNHNTKKRVWGLEPPESLELYTDTVTYRSVRTFGFCFLHTDDRGSGGKQCY